MSVNLSIDPTVAKLYTSTERKQDSTPRNYLGMSSMGEPCDRKLWHDFRQAKPSHFPAKTLFAFADGHYSELITSERIKAIDGVTLIVENDQGEQIGYVDFGGHFRGHMDGQMLGVLGAPNKWHVWEHKCSADKTYKRFIKSLETLPEKEVLEAWNLKYYAQAQLYMHYSKIDRHYLTVAQAGSREYQAARTDYHKATAERLSERAGDIIASDKPPEKITLKTDSFECRFCDYKEMCHGTALPAPHCRNCIFSYPVVDGSDRAQWNCQRFSRPLEKQEMHNKCAAHLYIPKLLDNTAEMTGANRENNTISYANKETGEIFTNGEGKGCYSSKELHDCHVNLWGDPVVNEIKKELGGVVKR